MSGKKNKHLWQYRGDLSEQQIVEGMDATIRNARRLADDAKTMLELSRYPTAAALAILSIEEYGKYGILRQALIAPNKIIFEQVWDDFGLHKRKNAIWLLPDMIANGFSDLDSLLPILDPTSPHSAAMENYKQLAMYLDCIGNAEWSEPEKVIKGEVARDLVEMADRLLADKKLLDLSGSLRSHKKNGKPEDGIVSATDFVKGFRKRAT